MQTHKLIFRFALIMAAWAVRSVRGEEVDNPNYVAWVSYKPGTTVTFKVTSPSFTSIIVDSRLPEEKPMEIIRTEKLIEILPSVVVLSITDSMENMKPVTTFTTIPARVDKNLAAIPPQLHVRATATFTDAKDSKETLQLKDEPLETSVHSMTMRTPTTTKAVVSHVDTWRSQDVPGGWVKMSVLIDGQKGPPRSDVLSDYSKATVATTRPAEDLDDRTPLGLLRKVDRGLLAGGIEASRATFHAQNAEGKSFAEVSALLNVSIVKLEAAARARFGAATSVTENIDHVAGDNGISRSDIETASVDVKGNNATVTFGEIVILEPGTPANGGGVVQLVKVDGHWRFDADAAVAGLDPGDLKQMIQWAKDSTALSDRLAKELADGKYMTEEGFTKEMLQEMGKITPAAFKP